MPRVTSIIHFLGISGDASEEELLLVEFTNMALDCSTFMRGILAGSIWHNPTDLQFEVQKRLARKHACGLGLYPVYFLYDSMC